MKKLISIILIICSFSQVAFASNCDWSQIKKLPNGDYDYSPQLNLCVGNLVQQNQVQAQQIVDLNKAISLKDLAINYDEQRIAMWEKTAGDEQTRLATMESDQKHSDWLMFGLGVVTTFAAAYAASRVYH